MARSSFWEILFCIICPPVTVGLVTGDGGKACLNFLLCMLFYIPGLIHAIYIMMTY